MTEDMAAYLHWLLDVLPFAGNWGNIEIDLLKIIDENTSLSL